MIINAIVTYIRIAVVQLKYLHLSSAFCIHWLNQMHAYLLNLHIFNNENCKQIKQLNVLESKYKLTLFLKRNVNIEFIFSNNVYYEFDKIGL